MPEYTYRCQACNEKYIKERKMKDRHAPITCPKCGSEDSKKLLDGPTLHNSSKGLWGKI